MNMPSALYPVSRQAGLTLVEILVALGVSAVLLTGVAQIYATSKQTYRVTDAVARMQEGARYAMDIMARDIRSAGLLGCGGQARTKVANAVDDTSSWYFNEGALMGYEGGVDPFPTELSGAVGDSDALILRRADPDSEYRVAKHVPDSATIHLQEPHDLQEDEILVIANNDCSQVGIFQMSNVNNNNTISVVDHNTGGSASPGNCTKVLVGDWDCSGDYPTNPTKDQAYDADSVIMRFMAHAYYIRASGSPGNPPALFRETLVGNTTTAQELIEGVEDMQILYGEDTDGNDIADRYVTANSVAAWTEVVSVRVQLLLQTPEDNVSAGAQTVTFDGVDRTEADRRLRMAQGFTVNLRNRVP